MSSTTRRVMLFFFTAVLATSAAYATFNKYGVVIGTVDDYHLEPDEDEGKWPHYHIHVQTPAGIYECVINMDTRAGVQILHRIAQLPWFGPGFVGLFSRANGYHELANGLDAGASTSGALDFIRMNDIWQITRTYPWETHQLVDTAPVEDTVPEFDAAMVGARRVYVFGAKYYSGLGVHCVHQNQGNLCPPDYDNNTWQDGAVIIEYDPIRLTLPGPCYIRWPGGLVCVPGHTIYLPNRKIIMTRFVVQHDFTETTGDEDHNGCADTTLSTTTYNPNKAANTWQHYGPFNTEQVEASLDVTAGNFDLYIRKGSQPDDSNYDVLSNKTGTADEFGWMWGTGNYYVSVKANGVASTGTLTIKRK